MSQKTQILLVLDNRELHNSSSDNLIEEYKETLTDKLKSYNNGFCEEDIIIDEIHFIKIVDVIYPMEAMLNTRSLISELNIADSFIDMEMREIEESE